MLRRYRNGRLGRKSRSEQTASLKAFAASLDSEGRAKPKETLVEEHALERNVNVVNQVVNSGEDAGESSQYEHDLRKRVRLMELELSNLTSMLGTATQIGAETCKVNRELHNRVNELGTENEKLHKLTRFLRQFELENREYRFILEDFFDHATSSPL